MSRRVQITLLCEDRQHETFARRFLEIEGWSNRRIRCEIAPKGCAEQFVRERFPVELKAYRANRNRVAEALVVMIDGDRGGVVARLRQLDDACIAKGEDVRTPGERVAVFVPTWRIETWLAYLDGESVTEDAKNYPRLSRPRECRRHVEALHDMCKSNSLRSPAPPSLENACEEYRSRLN